MSSQLSPICQKIATRIKGLESEKQSLAEDLKEAAPGSKSAIAAQIKQLNAQIAKDKKDLENCIEKNPFIPPPAPKANPCTSFAKEIAKLKAALNKEVRDAVADLQEELKNAAPGQKPAIAREIKQTSANIRKNSPTAKKIAALQKEYDDCIKKNGGVLALNATFKGTATMETSNADASGPFKQNVTIGLRFSEWDHRDITVTSFPPISVTYDVGFPVGEVTTTVTSQGAFGKFDPATKSVSLTLKLFFSHSTDLAGDSTLDITLKSAAPLTDGGKIKVSGSSKFKDGYLDGDTCWLTVEGTVSPLP